MAAEGFEQVVALHDRRSGLRAFLGIHDTERGPAFGGVRRWVYRDEREALLDCLRLARSMTLKCAALDLPADRGVAPSAATGPRDAFCIEGFRDRPG